jgi:hypothetical protein
MPLFPPLWRPRNAIDLNAVSYNEKYYPRKSLLLFLFFLVLVTIFLYKIVVKSKNVRVFLTLYPFLKENFRIRL